jgi:predicted MFS family arabinose efflux permease
VSLFASCFFLGQALGVSAGGLLYETRGALTVFGLAASVMVPLGAIFAVLLRRHHRRTA